MKPVIIAGVAAAALSIAGGGVYLCCSCKTAEKAPAPAAAPVTEAPAVAPEQVKEAETVPPWLKKQPGVKYSAPKKVPEIISKKYQSFEAAQEGSGEFKTTQDGGSSYQVNDVDPNSQLFTRLGLRKGDKVISVNGQPIGNSPAAGKAMYEGMKNETKFAVVVEREGKRVVLSFQTDEEK